MNRKRDIKKNSYVDFFNNRKVAENYEYQEYAKDSYPQFIWELEKKFLMNEIPKIKKTLKRKINYLDVACGTGRVASILENHVNKSTGVDVSEEMLKIAGEKCHATILKKIDITKNRLNVEYDLITCFRFILNADKKLRIDMLKSIHTHMKKDSFLIITIHANKFSTTGFFACIYRIFGKKYNHSSYSQTKKLLNKTSFKIVHYWGVGFLPRVLYKIKSIRRLLKMIDELLSRWSIFRRISYNQMFVVRKK